MSPTTLPFLSESWYLLHFVSQKRFIFSLFIILVIKVYQKKGYPWNIILQPEEPCIQKYQKALPSHWFSTTTYLWLGTNKLLQVKWIVYYICRISGVDKSWHWLPVNIIKLRFKVKFSNFQIEFVNFCQQFLKPFSAAVVHGFVFLLHRSTNSEENRQRKRNWS